MKKTFQETLILAFEVIVQPNHSYTHHLLLVLYYIG